MKAVVAVALACACSSSARPSVPGGVVFTFPRDGQLDVPVGAPVTVGATDPLDSVALVGPAGQVASGGGDRIVRFTDLELAPGTAYTLTADGEELVHFTTRSEQAAAPALVAVNGAPPATPEAFRPFTETSTIELVFAEPLDPRTAVMAPGAFELVDTATMAPVPATLVASGIHVAIDPIADLVADRRYELRLGDQVTDRGGIAVTPAAIELTPKGIGAPTPEVLRPRADGDPGRATSNAGGTPNAIAISHPLIGEASSQLQPTALATELGDPTALDGPIAFTIRKGQRLEATGLDVALGGAVPSGLSTGAIEIELLTDGTGRIYRNPYRDPDQRPDNDRAPLFVDMTLDIAIYAVDPTGNAVLTQTVLGVQATGTAIADHKVLDIEAVVAMDLDLLGAARASSHMVLELITDPAAGPEPDRTPPALVGTHASSDGVEIVFSEPIDLDRARGGGLRLQTAAGQDVPATIESRGAAVVLHAPLAAGAYRVALANVTDLAGNPLVAPPIDLALPALAATTAPPTVAAVHPGAACALTPAHRCVGAATGDDMYQAFALAANQPIDVAFTQPIARASIVRGTSCNTGSVRIEQLDAGGACASAVAGTLVVRERALQFVPAAPWQPATRYRLVLHSSANASCAAGGICGTTGVAASFDPLGGNKNAAAGGPDLVTEFVGAPPTGATYMLAAAAPVVDRNGSGFVEPSEPVADDNRAALRITGTGGVVTAASFNQADCIPGTPTREACMYLSGTMAVELQPLAHDCALPDGTTVPTCIPVALSPQAMYATSVALKATAFVDPTTIDISTVTGMVVLRLREPATGVLVDDHGTPTLIAALGLYLDAPDMSIPLMQHDLHSRPLAITLRGPLRFTPDGRIAIAVTNTADIPVTVNISATGLAGSVAMQIPAGEMKLQLVGGRP